MTSALPLSFLAVTMSASVALGAGPEDLKRLVVMDIQAPALGPDTAQALSQLVAFTARETLPGVEVMSRADIEALLALEAKKQLVGCDDASCMAQIVGALGADHLLVGTIGRLGARTLVEVRLIETSAARPPRQLSEETADDDATLAEVVAQLTGHLLDPRRPRQLAHVDIGGVGEVRVDGKPVGEAPVRRVPVTAGDHLIQWFAPPDATPIGEQRITARAYEVLRVEPEERQRGWDLAGLMFSAALGNAPIVRGEHQRTQQAGVLHTQIGYAFDSGITLQLGRTVQVLRQPRASGEGDVLLASDSGLAGVGYQTQGQWRWHFTLDGGPARIYSPAQDFAAEGGLAIEPAVALSYSFSRYFQLGARLAESYVRTESQRLLSTQFTVFVGLPSRGPEHYPQDDFHTSVAFWSVAGAVLLGNGAVGAAATELEGLSLAR